MVSWRISYDQNGTLEGMISRGPKTATVDLLIVVNNFI
jgi:hypothetical protein